MESYRAEIVQPLASNSVEDMDSNVQRVTEWVAAYRANNR